ncbi:glycosyl hydrolases family 43 domain-containing protein [Sarocladium implicatum]|nr:glycosyl hydrolases family 43 domain-containing protein [Sarocladium implicatum]
MTAVNPIIPGFAPDPSIVRAGDTYFLVTSTFQFFPGLPIFASKDLVSWSQIGNALHKPSQADLSRTAAKLSMWQKRELMVGNRGLYAPTLRYHNGTFYIICFNVIEGPEGEGGQSDREVQFIISTTDIYSNDWSDPVHFEFRGGDPSLFFEDDRVYVQIAQLGDFSIQQFEIDINTGEKLTESKEILAHSGRKWPESPHIYKRGGYYYLLIAEGGCFEHHMISVARSKDIWGPYEQHPENPILTAFETDNYIQHIGHADFVEDTKGDWWAVCLGVRKKDNCYIMGRETFLTPVTWVDDWPVISPVTPEATCQNGDSHKLPQSKGFQDVKNFLHIRKKDESKYDMKPDGRISLIPGPCDLISPHGDVTFIGKCQRALEGEAKVRLEPVDGAPKGVRAGLAVYKDEHRFLRIYYDWTTGELCFEAWNKPRDYSRQKRQELSFLQPLWLILQYSEAAGYKVSYRVEGSEEAVLLGTVEARMMTNYDFVGPVIGLFAVHDEKDGSDEQVVQLSDFEAA